MEQLSPLDASFLYLETARTPMHIGALGLYDPSTVPAGKPTFTHVHEFVARRLHRASRMRQRIVGAPLHLDHPHWVDDPAFCLDDHLHHRMLPPPGDWEQLCSLAATFFASPLQRTKALWEACIVEGLHNVQGLPPGGYALLCKVHHAAVDGLSGIEVMSVTHDLEPNAPPEPAPEWQPEPLPGEVELLRRAAVNAREMPRRVARSTARLARGVARGAGVLASHLNAPAALSFIAPRTRFNGVVEGHRTFGGEAFPLDTIKRIKNSQPATKVNDVVLTVCAGALRHYLDEKNELPDKPLLSMVPVSVRHEGHERNLGNEVAVMSVPLGTHLASPAERLAFVRSAQNRRKALLAAVGAEQLREYSALWPSALASLGSRVYIEAHFARNVPQLFNTVITNVPGPPVPIYNSGARMITMYGVVPILDGMGLGHVVNSYCDTLTISFTSCRTMMPDPELYSRCLRRSFDELASTV